MPDPIEDVRGGLTSFLDFIRGHAESVIFQQGLPLLDADLNEQSGQALQFVTDLRQVIVDAIDAIAGGSATPAQDLVNALNTIAGITATLSGPAGSETIEISVAGAAELALASQAIAADLGLPGLDLAFEGSPELALDLSYAFDFAFEYDVATGAFTHLEDGAQDLTFVLDGTVDLTTAAAIGFLGLDVTDNSEEPELQLTFTTDVLGGDPTVLGADDVTTTVTGDAQLALGVETISPSVFIPELGAQLTLDWNFNGAELGVPLAEFGDQPEITFNDIELRLLPFLEFLDGVFGQIGEVVTPFPLGDLLNVLTARLPVIDDLGRSFLDVIGDPEVQLIDIIQLLVDDVDLSLIPALSALAGISGAIDQLADFGSVVLGSVDILADARTTDGAGAGAFHFEEGDFDEFSSAVDTLFAELGAFSLPLFDDPSQILNLLLNPYTDEGVPLVEYDLPPLTFELPFHQFFPIVGPIGAVLEGAIGASIDLLVGFEIPSGGFDDIEFLDAFYVGAGEELPVAKIFGGISAGAGLNAYILSASVTGGIGSEISVSVNDVDHDGFEDDDGRSPIGALLDSGCIFDPISGEVTAGLGVRVSIGFGPFSFSRYFELFHAVLASFEIGCHGQSGEGALINHGLAAFSPDDGDLRLNAGPEFAELRVVNDTPGTDVNEVFVIRPFQVDDDTDPGPGPYPVLTVQGFGLEESFGAADNPVEQIVAGLGEGDDSVYLDPRLTQAAIISGGTGFDQIYGAAGNDILSGDGEDDFLSGGEGDDQLYGGDHNDTLEGREGADLLHGGEGRDQVSYEDSLVGVTFTSEVAFVPELNDEVLVMFGHGGDAEGDRLVSVEYVIGSKFHDVLRGNPNEENTLEGLEGSDLLIGGDAPDYILGGPNADFLLGGGNAGGLDATSYITSWGGVQINLETEDASGGDADGDRLIDIESVQGSGYDDVLTGSTGNNILGGAFGDDILRGFGGRDLVDAGDGDDSVYGDDDGQGDWLDGGGKINERPGRDLLSYRNAAGLVTVDLIAGGRLILPDDFPTASLGSEDVIRLSHVDEAYLQDGELDLDDEDDINNVLVFSTFENLEGSLFADTLSGDAAENMIRGLDGGDTLEGRLGNDTLIGGAGADDLFGGAGFDWADYSESAGGVSVDLNPEQEGSGFDAEGDTYDSVENLRGSRHDDVLIGSVFANVIDPGLGADVVLGLGGNDQLFVDYTEEDLPTSGGLIGGVTAGSADSGSIQRTHAVGPADSVQFGLMERFAIVGTTKDDEIYTGPAEDLVVGGGGDDEIWGGRGFDRLLGGDGDDFIVWGSNLDREFDTLQTVIPTEIVPLIETHGFQQLDGGDGFDALAYNAEFAPSGIQMTLGEGSAGNIILPNNTVIANFEQLFRIQTGVFSDSLAQTGRITNLFSTSLSDDVIAPGLGTDLVDGGRSWFVPSTTGVPSSTIEIPGAEPLTQAAGTEVLGDLLILDYRELDDGTPVVGNVTRQLDTTVAGAPVTNNGTYARGPDLIGFINIERLMVHGGGGGDFLVGAYGSGSRRGDDVLHGHQGNDFIVGRSGDDELHGGEGDDVLIGVEIPAAGTPAEPGRGEVDFMEGGDGADTFHLGLAGFVFYDDGNSSMSGADRAIILDFDAAEGDTISLVGAAEDYRSETVGLITSIYLRNAAPGSPDELIANLIGVAGFDLEGDDVVYDGGGGGGGGGAGDFTGFASLQAAARDEDPAAAYAQALGYALPSSARIAELEAAADLGWRAPGADAVQAADDLTAAPAIAPWVQQYSHPAQLSAALQIQGAPSSTSVQVSTTGDARAFGVFENDPFGLGSGIVISTGNAEDLAGVNEEDGGLLPVMDAPLEFVAIGTTIGGATIYRAEINNIGFDIRSFTLADDGLRGGGLGGNRSGFDLDGIVISQTRLDGIGGVDLNDPAELPRLDVFDFSPAGTIFTPGSQRLEGDATPEMRDLAGSINGMVDDSFATLGRFDFEDEVESDGETGFLTLGDGGRVGFDLTQPLASAGRPYYIYVAEAGGQEQLAGSVSSSNAPIGGVGDLSTDFGLPGSDGDTVSLTLSFFLDPIEDIDHTLEFNFAVASEELAEYAGTVLEDTIKITLNGVNLAELGDGAALTINNLSPSPLGPRHSDFIYNPVGTGPASDATRADGYTTQLTFRGPVVAGQNTLTIEVADVRDGGLDTAVLLQGGSLRLVPNAGISLTPVGGDGALAVSEDGVTDSLTVALDLRGGARPPGDLLVTLDPDDQLDLGNGAGEPITVTLGASLQETIRVAAMRDGDAEGDHFGVVQVSTRSSDPRFSALAIAPLVVAIADRAIAAIVGTPGDDHLVGDRITRADDDLMFGRAGNDIMDGRRGNDEIHGEEGNDQIRGGVGNDALYGGAGDDELAGGDGNDVLDGGAGINNLSGGSGDDEIRVVPGQPQPVGIHFGDPIFLGGVTVAGSGNDTAQIERHFLLISDDPQAVAANREVHDESTVDLGRGDDILENILNVGIDFARISRVDSISWTTTSRQDAGSGNDRIYDRFQFDTSTGRADSVALETVTIVHEGIHRLGDGSDTSRIDDLMVIDPASAAVTRLTFERTQLGGAGDDEVLDTGRLVVESSGARAGNTVIDCDLTLRMQQGSDRLEDRSTVRIVQSNESDFAFVSRLYDGGAGNDTLVVSGAYQIARSSADRVGSASEAAMTFSMTLDGGSGDDLFIFNPEQLSFTMEARSPGDSFSAEFALLGGAGRDRFVLHTDELLRGRSEGLSVAPEMRIDGGYGFDTVEFRGTAEVEIDLRAGIAVIGPDLGDDSVVIHLRNIENASAGLLL